MLLDRFPAPARSYLSIASAGDNSLSLLTLDPKHVLAIDRNPAQIALAFFKKCLLQRFDIKAIYGMLGVRSWPDRSNWYRRNLRPYLPEWVREFWDDHHRLIDSGVIHAGRFERYFRIYRRVILPLVTRRSHLRRLLQSKSLEEQARFFSEVLYAPYKERIFRLFFGRSVMSRLGRSKEQFAYVEGDISDEIIRRLTRGLTGIPTHTNPYIEYATFGCFRRNLPHYLQAAHLDRIRQNLDRLELRVASLHDAVNDSHAGKFDGYNLSDIFESMSRQEFLTHIDAVRSVSASGALLVYWNMMVPRSATGVVGITPRTEIAERYLGSSRAFFYGALNVEEIGS